MTNLDKLATGPLWYLAFLFSTVAHEAAHAWTAKRLGDPTAYHEGQASLDPRPHLRREPMGTVFVPIVTYVLSGWMMGWASAPYDPVWAERYPRKAAWMALAGPLAPIVAAVLTAMEDRIANDEIASLPSSFSLGAAPVCPAISIPAGTRDFWFEWPHVIDTPLCWAGLLG